MNENLPRPALPPDAYVLQIRQGPDRAKVPAAKDRDRKPIDPQPIVQLRVNDPDDSSNNYLQSPYFFMCCTLHPADESSDSASHDTLAGTTVSSLHRLKDMDNSDGGFFVFGDLVVMKPGHFKLRFSLFELVKTHVIFLTSILSNIFTAYLPKEFPGMLESTVLSRSFGDQGVKIKTRKEPRAGPGGVLRKPAPSRVLTHRAYHTMLLAYPPPPMNPVVSTPYHSRSMGEPHVASPHDHYGPNVKRQRTSAAMISRDSHEPEFSNAYHSFNDSRHCSEPPPTQYPTSTHAYEYPREPNSATSLVSNYTFGYPRTQSSEASSPYASPNTTHTGHSVASSHYYSIPQARDSSYNQPYQHDTDHTKQSAQQEYPTPPRQGDISRKRKAVDYRGAETLATFSHAPVHHTHAAFGNEIAPQASHGGSNHGFERPTLPPINSVMHSPSLGSVHHLRSNNHLPQLDTQSTWPRPNTQPYQFRTMPPPPSISSSAQ